MGRAFAAVCAACGTRLTVFSADGRVGLSPNVRDDRGPTDPDATLPGDVDLGPEGWPPCPLCGEFDLQRDPNSTDMVLFDKNDRTGEPPRRTEPLRAEPT